MLKFLYITQDPFKNTSNEFVRILAITNYASAGSSSTGLSVSLGGVLYDANGRAVAYFSAWEGYLNTEATAYPYDVGGYVFSQPIIIIPPNWSFGSFNRAIAVQGSLEEVLRVH